MGLSPLELGVCLLIVVLLFGVKRLPELGTGLGRGISNFRKAFREGSAIDVTPTEDSTSSAKNTDEKKEP
jgi:sec-independent protein translocase protein TatA